LLSLFSTRWQKIEEMHDLKDNRFKGRKDATKKAVKQTMMETEEDNDDEESLENELQGMYNWRQKRS
jgi:beta-xylosidase